MKKAQARINSTHNVCNHEWRLIEIERFPFLKYIFYCIHCLELREVERK